MQGLTEGSETELEWDPVARMRLGGHIRAFFREIVQQVLRGLGDTASWGQTPLTARVPDKVASTPINAPIDTSIWPNRMIIVIPIAATAI